MAKGNNTGKSKRSLGYKPYDASNSSFVKRITSRVTEILPGPSWISRWLTPTPQVNFRQDHEDEEDEEEEEKQQPPVKRIRLHTSLNDYTQQNHVKRLTDLQGNSEELSPISRIDHHDGAVAGPSGLQIRRSNFVSSTPATTQTSSPVIKVNAVAVDDGSDSNESTSGCSSLVPQDKRVSSNAVLPKLTAETHKVLSPGAVRTLSTSKDRYSKLNLSAGSIRPSFDHYVFHNPHNKSLNSSRSSQLDDSSTFYRGRTMYGGASASRESLNMSIISSASKPRVTNVKPVSRQGSERDTIGTSALRILRALEQISSPVTEAKKMPLNELQRRRKPIQPFEELVIPQMPTLLRLKRRQRSDSSSKVNASENKDVTDHSLVNSNEQPLSLSNCTENTSTSQFLPSYSLRKEELNKKEKYVSSIKGKNTELENERIQEVNLPNVKLNITSLPTFSLPTASNIVTASSTSLPVSNINIPSTSASNLSSASSRETSCPFKFSDPIVESNDGHRISSIKPKITFSNPLDAESLRKENELQNHSKLYKEKSSLKQEQNRFGNIKTGSFNPRSKRKCNQGDTVNAVSMKQSSNSQSGSVMDFFQKSNSEVIGKDKSKISDSPSFVSDNTKRNLSDRTDTTKTSRMDSMSSLQSSDNRWTCNKCLIENNTSDNNCKKCGISKLQDDKVNESSKNKVEVGSSDPIECKTCSQSYKACDNKCPTCSVTKSDVTTASNTNVTSTSSSLPLSALFKKSEGSWECSTCLVTNKSETDICVSCSTPKPGATPKPSETSATKPSFQFGIPSSTTDSTTGGFTFGFVSSNSENKGSSTINAAVGGFKFGNESNSSTTKDFKFGSPAPSSASDAKITFSFGCPQETSKKETEQSESKTPASKFTVGSVSTSEKVIEKVEDKSVQETIKENPPKKVTFSQQLVQEKTISSDIETQSTASSFNFSNNANTDKQSSSTFSFPSKTPIFSNITPLSSKPDNHLSNTLFKFGNPSSAPTTAATVSPVTTSTAKVRDNSVKVTSTLSSNCENEKASSTFSFQSNSAPKPIFASSETEKKEIGIFGGFSTNNKTSQFGANATPLSTNFTFGNSNNEKKTNAEKEVKKGRVTNNIFGEKRENEPTIFNLQQPQNEEKPNIFGSSKTENKSLFFTSNTNENSNIFGSAKTGEWNPKPAFGTETYEPKLAASFCTSTSTIPNNTELKNEPFTFNTNTTQTNSINPFMFKENDVSDNKPSGGFCFNAPSSTQVQNTNVFGTNTQPTPNVFGSATPIFNAAAQPNNNASGPSFAFGAPQPQQSQGIFCFSAPSQVAPSGAASMGETFTFGSQSAVPPSTPAATPAAPPTFDPNIKPNFNFSGGATPSFSAQSAASLPEVTTDRKIRKAVRRTKLRF
ncbi:uncharacterized protein isoform X2 [Rhodnius prolixus]